MPHDAVNPALDNPLVESSDPASGTGSVDRQSSAGLPFRYLKRRLLNIGLLGVFDVAALVIGLLGAGLLRYALKGDSMVPEWAWVVIVAWMVGAILFGLLPGWGLGAVEELRRVAWLTLTVFAVVAIGLFLGKTGSQISRLTLSTTFILAIPTLLFFRLEAKKLLIRKNLWGLPTVIYGSGDTARLAIEALYEERGLGYEPVGLFTDEKSPASSMGIPVLGNLTATTRIAPSAILAMSDLHQHSLVDLLEGPLATYRQVVIIPDLAEAPSLWVHSRDLGGVLGLEVSHNLMDPLARMIKRGSELLLVIGSSPVWLPLCCAVYVAIWLQDRDNPFFRQKRMGRKGHLFETWKFRTMVPNAERVLQERLDQDDSLRDEWELTFKLKEDPRVTRVGRFLRASSLDELPQLLNVLMGQMSLVGPRPLPMYHYEELPERIRTMRERVAPGITGLWQVSGRSDTGTDGMRRWDAYYVRNWSIWLDLVILVRTFRVVIRGRGAY